jgi:hypothetical protein
VEWTKPLFRDHADRYQLMRTGQCVQTLQLGDVISLKGLRQLRPSGQSSSDLELAEILGGLNGSVQHHLIELISFGGGVDETRTTVWTFCGAEDRGLASLEGGRVVA